MQTLNKWVDALNLTNWADGPARVLLTLLFIVSGCGKIAAIAGTQAYMEKYGVPGVLIWPTILLEVGGGLAVLVGMGVRPISVFFAVFCVLTASIFHTAFEQPGEKMSFFKDIAIAGAFLLAAKSGIPGLSLERLMSNKQNI